MALDKDVTVIANPAVIYTSKHLPEQNDSRPPKEPQIHKEARTDSGKFIAA